MKTINCEAELQSDGHLVLPKEVVKQIRTKVNKFKSITKRIIILPGNNNSTNRLSRFCGKWQDDREADEILTDIRSDREKNNRSDNINL